MELLIPELKQFQHSLTRERIGTVGVFRVSELLNNVQRQLVNLSALVFPAIFPQTLSLYSAPSHTNSPNGLALSTGDPSYTYRPFIDQIDKKEGRFVPVRAGLNNTMIGYFSETQQDDLLGDLITQSGFFSTNLSTKQLFKLPEFITQGSERSISIPTFSFADKLSAGFELLAFSKDGVDEYGDLKTLEISIEPRLFNDGKVINLPKFNSLKSAAVTSGLINIEGDLILYGFASNAILFEQGDPPIFKHGPDLEDGLVVTRRTVPVFWSNGEGGWKCQEMKISLGDESLDGIVPIGFSREGNCFGVTFRGDVVQGFVAKKTDQGAYQGQLLSAPSGLNAEQYNYLIPLSMAGDSIVGTIFMREPAKKPYNHDPFGLERSREKLSPKPVIWTANNSAGYACSFLKLPDYAEGGMALAINQAQDIVGVMGLKSPSNDVWDFTIYANAALWRGGEVYDLERFTTAQPDKWDSLAATAIMDDGMIYGVEGQLIGDKLKGFVLRPK